MSNIPQEHVWRYFFHMTDVRNLESIIDNGLTCTNEMDKHNIQHINIANENIQDRRSEMMVSCGKGGNVHDYVPFYFTSLNPMLLGVLNRKIIDQPFIIILCIKIQKMEQLNAIFTDASANTAIPPLFYNDVSNLNKLDWSLIDSKKWSYKDDADRHKKMAEVLIHNKVNFNEIDCIVVYNDNIKNYVSNVLTKKSINGVRVIFPHELVGNHYCFYFTKWFIPGQERITLVNGPFFLKRDYEQCVKDIIEYHSKHTPNFKFDTLESMLSAIEDKFDCLQELADIYDLETDNPCHPETVSSHTLSVVANIQETSFYKNCNDHIKCLLKLAAYLHDIGKGPKSKWKEGKQKPYPDHPSDAIPMLKRILSEDVVQLSDEYARKICLLVVYHDILGDCKFKGRNIQEIANVIESEEDLDMLFAISEADIMAINSNWYFNFNLGKEEFKRKILELWKQKSIS